MVGSDQGLWLFAYGSLMWKPDFTYREKRPAHVQGWHREFTVRSEEAWGTPDAPGICLALHPGGSVSGIAYRIDGRQVGPILARLDAREGAYCRRIVKARGPEGFFAQTLTYVANADHDRQIGHQDDDVILDMLAQGAGSSGTGAQYLAGAIKALADHGMQDPMLLRLLGALDAAA